MSKSFILLEKFFLGNFYRHLATFYWSHCCQGQNIRHDWDPHFVAYIELEGRYRNSRSGSSTRQPDEVLAPDVAGEQGRPNLKVAHLQFRRCSSIERSSIEGNTGSFRWAAQKLGSFKNRLWTFVIEQVLNWYYTIKDSRRLILNWLDPPNFKLLPNCV